MEAAEQLEDGTQDTKQRSELSQHEPAHLAQLEKEESPLNKRLPDSEDLEDDLCEMSSSVSSSTGIQEPEIDKVRIWSCLYISIMEFCTLKEANIQMHCWAELFMWQEGKTSSLSSFCLKLKAMRPAVNQCN